VCGDVSIHKKSKMGIVDLFRNLKNRLSKKSSLLEGNYFQQNESFDHGVHELAYASMKYEELQKDYKLYKKDLLSFGFDDSKVVHNTIGVILQYYYASDKQHALKLYHELDNDYPENEDIIWLFIEVVCTINIENDQEFVKKYLGHKEQHNDFNHHYRTEYQKGLELKSRNYFEEAIQLWTSLNKIQEFSWNYYQIGILQKAVGDDSYMHNLKKGIEMDAEIKEDAKSYHELNDLRTNPDFLKLIE
jgi:tetratricopeptide (TPR) repeat protein